VQRAATTRQARLGARSGFSNGCVEIWSGGTVNVSGQVNADIGTAGGPDGIGWIDVFAVGDITITGKTSGVFAVHANGGLAQNTDNGGLIAVKSREGKVTASNLAIQASALTCNGGKGGKITVEGKLDVNLVPGAVIHAKGCVPLGGAGGVVSIHSWGESPDGSIVSDAASAIDVTGNTPANGSIALTACNAIGFPAGTTSPATVTPSKAFACGGAPTFESYVVFPACQCQVEPEFGGCLKAPIRSVLDPDTGRFPDNAGPDVVVQLDLGQTVQDAVDTATDSNGDGYILILVVKDVTGIWAGTRTRTS